MSNGVRLDPDKLSPAILALMDPMDRARYAPTGPMAPAAAAMLTSDTGTPRLTAASRTASSTGQAMRGASMRQPPPVP